MTATKFTAISQFMAEQFIESVSEPDASNVYITIGKVDQWANDALPETSNNTIQNEIDIWKNMYFAKKLTGNDVALITPRINWTSNTVYTPYHHRTELTGQSFYVLTDDFNVYKCLGNNSNVASTIKPTYTGVSSTNRTSDGYLWKYMYSIGRSDRIKFLNDQWMPVVTLTLDNGSTLWDVQQSAVKGAIESVKITNAGQGYSSDYSYNVSISGDGTGATANLVPNTITNTVQFIVMTNRGLNYTYANITITSSNTNANGATVEAIISPFGGHGSDPSHELKARGVMINIRLKGNENSLLKTGNDFRQIGVLHDPIKRSTNNVSSNSVITQAMNMTLTGSGSDFQNDEWVYQGASLATATFKGKVAYFGGTLILLTNIDGTPTATTLTGATSAATRFVAGYSDGDWLPYTGKIMYVDNILPITRSDDQVESLQIPILF